MALTSTFAYRNRMFQDRDILRNFFVTDSELKYRLHTERQTRHAHCLF